MLSMIDDSNVTQLVCCIIDKSSSMNANFDCNLTRFQSAQKFFIKFVQSCYKYHITSLHSSIMFNDVVELRNELNPIAHNFESRFIKPGEVPTGGARIFSAIRRAANLLLDAKKKNRFANAVLRIIVFSSGEDQSDVNEIAQVSNYILLNNIKIDSIFLTQKFANGLVAISRYTGCGSFYIQTQNEGLDFFNKEEFYNPEIRLFKNAHSPDISVNDISHLPNYTVNDLNENILIKPIEFAKNELQVTTPSGAISQFESSDLQQFDFNAKRIISELKRFITTPNENIKVFPLKDRIDVWRVLLKGPDGSLYAGKWFYMIIEFPKDYPYSYPLMRFVLPPFHPNISDLGRIDLNELYISYRSDTSVRQICEWIINLLLKPEFDNSADLRRLSMKDNESAFLENVNNWNKNNGKNSSEEWERQWRYE